ncbi:MAG: hypothetical protein KF845_01090 [Cyclobacteriaceae bacterium]|nr:hypothetical protein [Cyclobacteriaceae bacterium]
METDDLVKSQLLKKAAQQRQEIKSEMHDITDRTEEVLTNAVIIGGALALTYFLVRGFSSKKKRKGHKAKAKIKGVEATGIEDNDEDEEESGPSAILRQIGTAVATQATVLLLDLAKEKLMEYLQARLLKKADENS